MLQSWLLTWFRYLEQHKQNKYMKLCGHVYSLSLSLPYHCFLSSHFFFFRSPPPSLSLRLALSLSPASWYHLNCWVQPHWRAPGHRGQGGPSGHLSERTWGTHTHVIHTNAPFFTAAVKAVLNARSSLQLHSGLIDKQLMPLLAQYIIFSGSDSMSAVIFLHVIKGQVTESGLRCYTATTVHLYMCTFLSSLSHISYLYLHFLATEQDWAVLPGRI